MHGTRSMPFGLAVVSESATRKLIGLAFFGPIPDWLLLLPSDVRTGSIVSSHPGPVQSEVLGAPPQYKIVRCCL